MHLKTLITKQWHLVAATLLGALIGVGLHIAFEGPDTVHIKELRAKYSLIDVSRHLIPKEHFLTTLQPLRERLYDFVASEEDMFISVYVEFLNTGANIHINSEQRVPPASLAKVPIALATMGTIKSGRWSHDTRLALEEGDRGPSPSTIHTRSIGTQFTIDELLEELLINSDNTAYRILLRNIPQSEIRSVREAVGLEGLFDEEGRVTSKEFSRTLRILYTASYLSREDSQFLLELLNRSAFTYFLRQSIPENIPFPHKYGVSDITHSYNDSGIVYLPNRPYLITVMLKGKGDIDFNTESAHATEIMQKISAMAFEYFSHAGL